MYRTILFSILIATLTAGCVSKRTFIASQTISNDEMIGLTLAGKGKAIVNWGDGAPVDTVSLHDIPFNLREMSEISGRWRHDHYYRTPGEKTITVSGRLTGVQVEKKAVEYLSIVADDTETSAKDAETTQIEPQKLSVKNRRKLVAGYAANRSDLMPVSGMFEYMEYNDKTIEILGYAREESRGMTGVMIPNECTNWFVPWGGNRVSQVIHGTVIIRSGVYAGTWNAWYTYCDPALSTQHTSIYIDAPWNEKAKEAISSMTGKNEQASQKAKPSVHTIEALRDIYRVLTINYPECQPVSGTGETLEYNGISIPIVGYQRDESKGLTIAIIPIEYTDTFVDNPGGSLSGQISGKAKIHSGKYAGTWDCLHLYTKVQWNFERIHIHIDAPWIENKQSDVPAGEDDVMIEVQ
jgi:hypothetical protein